MNNPLNPVIENALYECQIYSFFNSYVEKCLAYRRQTPEGVLKDAYSLQKDIVNYVKNTAVILEELQENLQVSKEDFTYNLQEFFKERARQRPQDDLLVALVSTLCLNKNPLTLTTEGRPEVVNVLASIFQEIKNVWGIQLHYDVSRPSSLPVKRYLDLICEVLVSTPHILNAPTFHNWKNDPNRDEDKYYTLCDNLKSHFQHWQTLDKNGPKVSLEFAPEFFPLFFETSSRPYLSLIRNVEDTPVSQIALLRLSHLKFGQTEPQVADYLSKLEIIREKKKLERSLPSDMPLTTDISKNTVNIVRKI